MEITLFCLVVVAAMFFTYLSFARTVDQTEINQGLAAALWAVAAGNSFVLKWFIPSDTSYTELTKNSEYYQVILGVVFAMVSLGLLVQLGLDRSMSKRREAGLL